MNAHFQIATSVAHSCPLIPALPTPTAVADQSSAPDSAQKRRASLKSPIRYRIAFTKQDLREAFGLVYESYVKAGLAQANETQVRVTPFHLLPTTEVFVTSYAHQVVSTVSLIGDGYLGLPLATIYPDEIADIHADGLRMAEIGCLADRRSSPVRFIETFATMGRLLAQTAKVRGYDGLVAALHPKHARLYKRILPFEQVGRQIECPYANGNPAVMLRLRFDDHLGSNLYERFFGSMASGLDTTHRPWSAATRNYFKQFLDSGDNLKKKQIQGAMAVAAFTGHYPS